MRVLLLLLLLSSPSVAEVPVIWHPPASFGPTLSDIASRLPRGTDAREPDLITYGHEGSHFLSVFRPGEHGLYGLKGQVHWIPIPPIRTGELFRAIPEDERGTIWETYQRQGVTEGWRDRPTMVLDEWTAYLRGSMIRRELGIAARQETDRHCETMARYARVLCRLTLNAKNYDRTKLVAYCRSTLSECRRVIPEFDPTIEFE